MPPRPFLEGVLWILAAGLLSPLVACANRGFMPLFALFGVAAGIALALALAGRRLHAMMISEVLSGRDGVGRLVMTAGMVLLVLLLVLLGAVVALYALVRGGVPRPPV